MNLTEKINDAIKTAMKAKDKASLQALRAVKAAILLVKTEGGSTELNDESEIKLLQKLVKQRIDAANIYKEQKRTDLYELETFEAEIISGYLPTQLSEEELHKEIIQIIEETNASSMKDMGKVMGIASKKLSGKTDGRSISSKVKELLMK